MISLPVAYYLETIREDLYSIRIKPIVPFVLSAFAFIATSKGIQTCFFDDSAVYNIHYSSRERLIEDLKSSELDVTFSRYNDTRYDDEHAEFHNLNDSISNLTVLIKDFNKSDSTVEISLGCWSYNNWSSLDDADEQLLEKHRTYVRRIFENEVLEKMGNYAP